MCLEHTLNVEGRRRASQRGPRPHLPHPGELAYLFFNFCQRFDGDSQEIKGLHLKIHQVILLRGWKKCCFTFALLHNCDTSNPTAIWCFLHSSATETISVTPQCCGSRLRKPGCHRVPSGGDSCLGAQVGGGHSSPERPSLSPVTSASRLSLTAPPLRHRHPPQKGQYALSAARGMQVPTASLHCPDHPRLCVGTGLRNSGEAGSPSLAWDSLASGKRVEGLLGHLKCQVNELTNCPPMVV